MSTRFVAVTSLITLAAGWCLVMAQTPMSATQRAETPAMFSESPRMPPAARPVPEVVQQMQALESHSRYAMICYPGRIGQSDLALRQTKIDAIALNLRGSSR